MSSNKQIAVKDLVIDLANFRTVIQTNEQNAVHAMISISPAFFWGLMESLLDDGYLPTENIIVLERSDGTKVVKEGNRRIAALKIALKVIDTADLDLPPKIVKRIAGLSSNWIVDNTAVPCTVYGETDSAVVDKIITLTHGKGIKAGRDTWSAVARARHSRDMNGSIEAGLDLLEKFFIHSTNHTQEQRDRWAGDYSLTVLDEAIKKIASRLGSTSSLDLAKQYPKIEHKKALDDIIRAIGLETLGFSKIRGSEDFATLFGIPLPPSQDVSSVLGGDESNNMQDDGNSGASPDTNNVDVDSANTTTHPAESEGDDKSKDAQLVVKKPSNSKVIATPLEDEKSVKRALKSLKIMGQNRAKVATLRIEAGKLKLKDNPIAFCFLLRSMFEISAKAYCDDHSQSGLSVKKSDGSDKFLMDVLRDIINHLTQNKKDKTMLKMLHGPATELGRTDGILSITSLNQLVHHPTFAINSSQIPTTFAAVFPLLIEMNK
ncbi:hypothetical protein [Solimicrobium silvestre]|uniref:Uncharacterized protein n=1 Tax=Solimicrobium silvestre TaxID=2099400 RepID=A0A2S9GZH6_9BURK|nr:hypothetical protein [Solimicrobium silvestre]PRC93108.1 hypothetical protein S2091_2194 [Solimicrobium silvestre]